MLSPARFVLWSHHGAAVTCQPAGVNRLTRGNSSAVLSQPYPSVAGNRTGPGLLGPAHLDVVQAAGPAPLGHRADAGQRSARKNPRRSATSSPDTRLHPVSKAPLSPRAQASLGPGRHPRAWAHPSARDRAFQPLAAGSGWARNGAAPGRAVGRWWRGNDPAGHGGSSARWPGMCWFRRRACRPDTLVAAIGWAVKSHGHDERTITNTSTSLEARRSREIQLPNRAQKRAGVWLLRMRWHTKLRVR
jgi:hypothetical protein